MCDEVETSREHAPPRCLFPTEAEAGRNLRVNLITVPSCDRHNSEKSTDDEFFRAIVLGIAAHNSPVAADHFRGKLLRAAARNPTTYGTYFDEQGQVHKGAFRVLKIDRTRLDACLVHIARALYFHATKQKWWLPIYPISPNLFSETKNDAPQPHALSKDGIALAREYLSGTPIQGSNPEVFRYRMKCDDIQKIFVLAAIFYESFEIFCYSSKAMAEAAI